LAYLVITAIIDEFEAYYMSLRDGDHQQIAFLYQKEEEFDEAFRKLGIR
jgi:hypothetical protein